MEGEEEGECGGIIIASNLWMDRGLYPIRIL
jgi:hypothetical protein